jgi:hypothetical protein
LFATFPIGVFTSIFTTLGSRFPFFASFVTANSLSKVSASTGMVFLLPKNEPPTAPTSRAEPVAMSPLTN